MSTDRGSFGRIGFIMAAIGSAVGLGNIWKFPYITYANNGGSFVLIYLVAILVIGAPIMLAEILVGRHTRLNPVGAFRELGKSAIGGRAWSALGLLTVCTVFLISSYYFVVAGWTVYYCGRSLVWSLGGFDLDGAAVAEDFGAFLSNGPLQITFHAIFTLATVAVVSFGVRAGIERVAKIAMPMLGILLLGMALYSISMPGFGEAIRFLFHIGPIDNDAVLEAVGHAFFTLGVGMGVIVAYGSYMSSRQSIPRAGALVCVFDTLIALLACVVMFSIIFTVPEAERSTTFAQSATILFTTLPAMFYSLPLGALLAPLFYLLVVFAALTSTISGVEALASTFIDNRGWSRRRACLTIGVVTFALGIPCALSFGAVSGFSNWQPLGDLATGVFDTFDYLVSNWLLPVGGLGSALFVGWFLDRAISRAELERGHGRFGLFSVWRFVLRFVTPVGILWVLWAVISGRSFS